MLDLCLYVRSCIYDVGLMNSNEKAILGHSAAHSRPISGGRCYFLKIFVAVFHDVAVNVCIIFIVFDRPLFDRLLLHLCSSLTPTLSQTAEPAPCQHHTGGLVGFRLKS